MDNADFTTTILVDQSPMEVFNAITQVSGWWSEEVQGTTDKINGVFDYHYQDVHISKIQVLELMPGELVVWHVLENYFKFTNDKREWTNTRIVFEIGRRGDGKTKMKFTHEGLRPEVECYSICQDAWSNYINISLRNLIVTGKGAPNPAEGGFNESLISKHSIEQR